ncbi:MAG TPA: amidohydrolase family protein, partial [Flexilinea sp.]|nr:amidohydrolase family protein [Flexilinea sp.]
TPEGDEVLWQKMIRLGLNENVYLGISAMPILLNDPYPCNAANDLLKRIVKLIGSNKLIWGTDAPTTLKMYTYRQLIDWVLIHSDFISEVEKENILFNNAEKLYLYGG